MKNNIIILFLVLFSLIGGVIGSYGFLQFGGVIFPTLSGENQEIEDVPAELEKTPAQVDLVSLESSITDEVAQVAPSVVSIIVKKDLIVYRSDPYGFFQQPIGNIQRQVGGGTGFFITKDGIILTNKHVIADTQAIYTVISNDGKEYDAEVIATDPINDLAVIQIVGAETQDFTPLSFIENLENIELGSFVVAIGNALAEFQNSVSLGIISGKDRSLEASGEKLTGLIQTDAAINPGNSGGPLIDLNGKVLGINTAIAYDSTGIGFAIGLTQEKIDYILKSIQETGTIKRPFIGINYIPNSPGVQQELGLGADYGAYIIDESGSILEGSSAAEAGLEPGDIILEINGVSITPTRELGSFVQNAIPGQTLKMKVLKKSGETGELDIILGSY